MTVVELDGVSKSYRGPQGHVTALRDVSLSIRRGEYVAIVGPSGSGKSTLLTLLGCLDAPDRGGVRFLGQEVSSLDGAELARLRGRHIGFVFQGFQLLADYDLLSNVALPLWYAGHEDPTSRAAGLLREVGLGDRLEHRPHELSGGQCQRAALARALANGPDLILADEPTGSLDIENGQAVLALFERSHAEGRTVVVVTHDPTVARRARRVVHVVDGRILSDRTQS